MRILIAEDEPVSRLRLRRLLESWGYRVTAVADGERAWQILRSENAPSLAILDWQMPGRDGVSVCRCLRAREDKPYVYVILLTARRETHCLVEAISAGADDYLTKPFELPELQARLRAGKRIVQLQEELIEAREALREQATFDPLTGACNRRVILEALDRELARVARGSSAGLGVLAADLDHFKRVNDRHGHLVGDEVLRAVVRRIEQQVRQYDSVGRLGGEEFLLLLADCDREHLEAAAERIRDRVASRPFATAAGSLSLTLSLGAAWVPSGRKLAGREILDIADRALYTAKAAGRNRLCLDPSLPSWIGLAAPAPAASAAHLHLAAVSE